ncbi:MAG: PAS domain S-box protein [Bryobacteraceae bacterium]|nr:PAS domain S-box protein [Bryobacterales bacterium]MEB2362677.1 PAS domain S-box protein [Bryobacterales bacterium]NUN02604.1 PAS domain S-box protein [Bryobacteraceae bacterium]
MSAPNPAALGAAFYDTLFDNFVEPAFIAGEEVRCADVNRRLCELLKMDRQRLIGSPFTDFIPEEVRGKAMLAFEELRSKGAVHLDTALRSSDGSVIELEWNCRTDPASGLHLCFGRDVTERKKIEEECRRLAAIVESSDDAIISKTLEGIVTSWNSGAERVFGYTAEEMIGKPVSILAVPGRNEMTAILEKIRLGQPIKHYETQRRRKDGRLIVVSLSVSPMRDSSGRITGASKIARDVTDRKLAEQALADANQTMLDILESMDEGFIAFDGEGRCTYVNGRVEEVTQKHRSELLGKVIWDVLPEMRGKKVFSEVEHVRKERITVTWEEYFAEHDAWYQGHAYPRRDGVALFIRNITERKRAEEALAQHAEEAARSSADLQQFAYATSHDLQEPLRNIVSFSQLLAHRYRDKLDSDAAEFIGYIEDGARRMELLITDLVAYSRVASGRSAEHVLVEMDSVIDWALRNLDSLIKDSGAVVSRDPLPVVKGDKIQLVQLIQRLVENAIRYRGPEDPRIHISSVQAEREWWISVKDNGIGIEPQYSERIFGLFKRLNRNVPGTGVGLAICKRIAEKHGGRIWVESKRGQGSTFRIALPASEI